MAFKIRNSPKSKQAGNAAAAQAHTKFQQAYTLYQIGQLAQAQTILEALLKKHPNHYDALQLLSLIAFNRKEYQTALRFLDKSLTICPDAAIYSNRGIVLYELRQLDAAVASYDRAIALEPGNAEAYSNRGNALKDLGRLDAAVASYDQAIALRPDIGEVRYNKSLALLLGGDFVAGWEGHEWRWMTEKMKPVKRTFPQPLWLGRESVAGRTILLHSEQGFGDTIQFCRYAKLVADLDARVILEVPESLLGLVKQLSWVSEFVIDGNPLPAFEYHCPLLSLPLAFKTTLSSIPCPTPYLRADPGKLSYWTSTLGEKRSPRVGLVWGGSPEHTNDRNRSIGLAALVQHLPAGFEYVSLQKDVRDSDKPVLESNPHILHLGKDLDDFTDTAALCELMDVVISVDTSVAHLSGALGKSTWVLLPFSPDWRWLLERDDSPWYPSVKLFRQPRVGDWDSVLDKVKADMALLRR
jgi:predicted negative regulator of RcsB-dependent stress response